MRRLALLLPLLVLAACDSGGEEAPALDGLYVSSTTDASVGLTITVTLDLATSGGAFTLGPRSRYRIEGEGGADEGTLTGSGTYTGTTLTLRTDALDLDSGFGLDASTFTGTASADGAVLTLTVEDETLTFRR